MKKVKIGDIVIITNPGSVYPSWEDLANEFGLVHFIRGYEPKIDEIGNIIKVGRKDIEMYAMEINYHDRDVIDVLIRRDGFELLDEAVNSNNKFSLICL